MTMQNINLERLFGGDKALYCRFKRFGIYYVDYKNADFLLKFLNAQGKILPRSYTGNSVTSQDLIKKAIERARYLALLPYVADNLK
ncbi:MAG: 30S ribosomal protein S18 [Cytophagales bacterium]|nr:30S ribosomal protein S18 [Cytophagales bacterium]